jgi:hypothetical protein
MPGYAGKFFLQNDGTVRVEGNKPLKVDLSGVSIQTYNNYSNVNSSEIVITTDDGYKYYFGGTIQYLEYSYSLINGGAAAPPEINAWHLSKIEAPNGRTAIFQYNVFDNPSSVLHSTTDHYLLSLSKLESGESTSWVNNSGSLDFTSINSSQQQSDVMEMTKTVYIKSIKVDQKVIEFNYSAKAVNFYNGTTTVGDNGLKLDNIVVKNENNPIYTFQFGYHPYQANETRLFLKSITESGKNSYLFEYYIPANGFSNPQTTDIDYWGFWKGGYTIGGLLIPQATIASNGDLVYTSTEREPNSAVANFGLLKRVTYPTNGSSFFEYEGHSYSKRLERRRTANASTDFMPLLYSVNGNAGGARIARITDYDGTIAARTREFKYVKDFTAAGTVSSGIILHWPRYLYYWEFDTRGAYGIVKTLYKKSSSYHVNHDPGENFIQYGEVTELVMPNGGCTTYKFTNYETNPDVSDYHTSVVIQSTQDYVQPLVVYNNYIGVNLNERSFERGLPKEVTTYSYRNSTFYPVKKSITDYTDIASYPDYYVTSVHQTGGIAQSTKEYYYPFLPIKQTDITYSNDGQQSVSMITDMTYTAQNYPLTTTTSQSDAKVYKTKYKYVSDYISSAFTTYYQNLTNYNGLSSEVKALVNLYENNMLNRPIEIISSLDGKITAASFITYQDIGNSYKSKRNYTFQKWGLKTKTELSAFVESSITANTWVLTKNASYSATPDVVLAKYDSKGNVIEQIDRSGVTTAVVWGYNYSYPIAEIKNASYQDVINVLGQTVIDQLNSAPGTDAQVRQKLQVLRSATSLNKARVTTYTQSPLVGMTSVTDINGFTTYYQYDSFNRLKLILDKDQNIIKRYNYNYQAR